MLKIKIKVKKTINKSQCEEASLKSEFQDLKDVSDSVSLFSSGRSKEGEDSQKDESVISKARNPKDPLSPKNL